MTLKTIIITGTRKGIGYDLAKAYAEEGHQVIGCSRGETQLSHPNYTHITCDISNETEVLNLWKTIRQKVGHSDILINNAGIASMNHMLLTPVQTVKDILDTNVAGTYTMSREGAKLMKKKRWGRIINLSSIAVALRLEGEAIYAASKSSIESLTRIMAKELGRFGITVNAVGPTPTNTDIIRGVPQKKINAITQQQAIKRLGTIQDIKNVLDFYIDDKSDFVTGQVMYLGGIS